MTPTMIQARGLVQTFTTGRGKNKREVRAVDGVDLDIHEGEVVGFLGPNGAGKTTTLRMLTTLLRPTAGTATVNGYDVVRESVMVRRSIGYVSQAGGTFSQARAGDEVVDHGMLYGLSHADATRRGHELFSRLQLDGLWERQPKNMSGGQKRRLDIAMGLIHDPSLVFLDEPTTGLDPRSRHAVWDRVRALVDGGTTVFLTTQYLDEADQLADHIAVLDQGRIVAEGTAAQLKRLVPGGHVSLEFADAETMERAREQFPTAVVDTRAGTHVLAVPGDGGSDALRAILQTLDTAGLEATGLSVHTPDLDDVFLTLTGRAAA